MYRLLGHRLRFRGWTAWALGRAPPSVTSSVSAPRPSVPKMNEPSDGSSEGSIRVAAAPSPKIVRNERSVGSMYFV